MTKGIKYKPEASIRKVLIIIKIRSICSDGSSDYKCFICNNFSYRKNEKNLLLRLHRNERVYSQIRNHIT